MTSSRQSEFLAVYGSDADARAAVRALESAGIDVRGARVDEERDHITATRSQMRGEVASAVAGPGNVGPFTKEMFEGSLVFLVLGALIGALIALPFAAIPFGDLGVWSRVLIVSLVGVVVGGTAGWVIGGGFGAKRPEEPLDAESGVTIAIPATDEARTVLVATQPRRLDLISPEGNPVSRVEGERVPLKDLMRHIGRNMGSEDRRG